MLMLFLAAALALQDAPANPAEAPNALPALDSLPIGQAASARCAIAFATIGRWQKTGDARGQAYPDAAAGGGREFFVRVMARLMDEAGLTRVDVAGLTAREDARNDSPEGAEQLKAIMPACELMKTSAGL